MRILIFVITIVSILTSCKTTEANYRAAYDVAKARQAQQQTDDEYDEDTMRLLERTRQRGESTHVVGSDTIKVSTVFVKMTLGETDKVPRYSVVLNRFSQIFNAKAMCKRLRENGFPHAYIFESATPEYYVALSGSNDIAEIAEMLKQAHKAKQLGTKEGYPKVICSGGWRPK